MFPLGRLHLPQTVKLGGHSVNAKASLKFKTWLAMVVTKIPGKQYAGVIHENSLWFTVQVCWSSKMQLENIPMPLSSLHEHDTTITPNGRITAGIRGQFMQPGASYGPAVVPNNDAIFRRWQFAHTHSQTSWVLVWGAWRWISSSHWSAQLPDLNIVGPLWSVLVNRVRSRFSCTPSLN